MIEARDFDLQWEGRRCIVRGLGADKSLQVARRVANLLGEGMKAGDEKSVVVAIGAVLATLTDDQLKWFVTTFEDITDVEREAGSEDFVCVREVRDLAFGGSAGLMRRFRWLQFCLEVCCGDFLVAIRHRILMGLKAMAMLNQYQSTSGKPGSSTESPSAGTTTTAS